MSDFTWGTLGSGVIDRLHLSLTGTRQRHTQLACPEAEMGHELVSTRGT